MTCWRREDSPFLSGRREGRGWLWEHTDCPDSDNSTIKMFIPTVVIKKKNAEVSNYLEQEENYPETVFFFSEYLLSGC